jgi:hypothetical protein
MASPPARPQTKGTTYVPTVKFLRSRKEQARALLPPELHRYLQERILPSSWYPEDDLVTLLRVLVRLLPGDPRQSWESIGARAAENQFGGPFEVFLRGGLRHVVESFGALWQLQHDSGRWTVTLSPDEPRGEAQLHDFAVGMPEYGPLMTGYSRRVLLMAGARTADCELVRSDASSATWRLGWTE